MKGTRTAREVPNSSHLRRHHSFDAKIIHSNSTSARTSRSSARQLSGNVTAHPHSLSRFGTDPIHNISHQHTEEEDLSDLEQPVDVASTTTARQRREMERHQSLERQSRHVEQLKGRLEMLHLNKQKEVVERSHHEKEEFASYVRENRSMKPPQMVTTNRFSGHFTDFQDVFLPEEIHKQKVAAHLDHLHLGASLTQFVKKDQESRERQRVHTELTKKKIDVDGRHASWPKMEVVMPNLKPAIEPSSKATSIPKPLSAPKKIETSRNRNSKK
eukprot:c21426_g1_i1.p1 GENE.c21426_g1_i1~~c21426_g1_i1.p1  ORF type:complete len:279 (+),score=28.89 c21426_g1_i1:22-837(+)